MQLLYDLQLLAYQSDLTRVITFMYGREQTGRPYPQIGIPEPHHPLTHHQNDAVKMEKCTVIQIYHVALFAAYLEKLRATPDGDGSLLDHMMLLYGGGISNSDRHTHGPLPTLLLGGGAGHAQGRPSPRLSGRHAVDEPAADAARQDGRAGGETRRQHGAVQRTVRAVNSRCGDVRDDGQVIRRESGGWRRVGEDAPQRVCRVNPDSIQRHDRPVTPGTTPDAVVVRGDDRARAPRIVPAASR